MKRYNISKYVVEATKIFLVLVKTPCGSTGSEVTRRNYRLTVEVTAREQNYREISSSRASTMNMSYNYANSRNKCQRVVTGECRD